MWEAISDRVGLARKEHRGLFLTLPFTP
jgi:hypothetical protein